MELFYEALPELIATLIGVMVGGAGALYIESKRELSSKRNRRQIVLHDIRGELEDNHLAMEDALRAYQATPYGKSFYINTIAWKTATAGGDLPEIIGSELADIIENQYAVMLRLRYYVDLMTRLWFAPDDIDGKREIRQGFRRHIIHGLEQAIASHPSVIDHIDAAQAKF